MSGPDLSQTADGDHGPTGTMATTSLLERIRLLLEVADEIVITPAHEAPDDLLEYRAGKTVGRTYSFARVTAPVDADETLVNYALDHVRRKLIDGPVQTAPVDPEEVDHG